MNGEISGQRRNQPKLGWHLEQVWYDSVQDRVNAPYGYFQAHDYDLLLIVSIGGTIAVILAYIIVCDIIYVCFCYKGEGNKKQRHRNKLKDD